MIFDRNSHSGNNLIPFINNGFNADADVKLNEDQYEVYVNGNFVGNKTLKTQGENLSDIDDFLKNQGFSNFSTSIEGNHYNIHTNDLNNDIPGALSVYFNNR